MRRLSRAAMLTVSLTLASVALSAVSHATPPVHEFSFDSKSYEIDQIYRSMKGPQSTQVLRLAGSRKPAELIWIVGYRTEIVGLDGGEISPEFMCHNNLNFVESEWRRQAFGDHHSNPRLFTLSQGQMEVRFPAGFGLPISSHEPLAAMTQVLNLNPQDSSFGVKHRTTLYFVRESELEMPMQALYQISAQGLVSLHGPGLHFNQSAEEAGDHGPGCAVGTIAGTRVIKDRDGREFAAHWTVPPGREVNRTLISNYLSLDRDTTIHYIAVHLHPFAESVELRDLTSGETLFKSEAIGSSERIGLERVEHFSSEEGLRIYKDHAYELVSVYNNTTDVEQDAMAVMFLYLYDRKFQPPALN